MEQEDVLVSTVLISEATSGGNTIMQPQDEYNRNKSQNAIIYENDRQTALLAQTWDLIKALEFIQAELFQISIDNLSETRLATTLRHCPLKINQYAQKSVPEEIEWGNLRYASYYEFYFKFERLIGY
ncbi:MAG: hypothetical protein EZS28_043461 [Streblomastix strix]|uniref:Uncharacterized protein n=1 Tax=Streblomastix strix TaxID=222440 RepID=A0A5J4TSX6_9EUKA|nr:MAG: hypothetical protein EZS28_043461 [Streblomastix strix]